MHTIRNIYYEFLVAIVFAALTVVSCAEKEPHMPFAPELGDVTAEYTTDGLVVSANLVSNSNFKKCGFLVWKAGMSDSYATIYNGEYDSSTGSFTSVVKYFNFNQEYCICAFITNGVYEHRSDVRSITIPVTVWPVDLGLSVIWADCNLGAKNPEDDGYRYQWAGVVDVKPMERTLGVENCPYHLAGSGYLSGWTKYITSDNPDLWAGSGLPDNKVGLEPEDDAATVALGGNWQTPTPLEWNELMHNCDVQYVKDYKGSGVAGKVFTSKKDGYTDKSIFIPSSYFYWTSISNGTSPYLARCMYISTLNKMDETSSMYRYTGMCVRPVCAKK